MGTSKVALLGLALISVGGGGCAQVTNPKLIAGSYAVMVSAFGKSDSVIVVATAGSGDTVLLDFNYGITTDPGDTNATGLRARLNGSDLDLDMQPIHVDHSTGTIDGTVVGIGTAGGQMLDITLKVTPTNVSMIDGMPYVMGTTIDYQVEGTKQ